VKAIDLDAPPSGAPLSAELIQFQEALRQMSVRSAANGDEVQAAKLQELAGKLEGGRLTVAFCGHFSAGKSTLVNTLAGRRCCPPRRFRQAPTS